ncbi:hypothetical protein PGT21_006559 [Puccinia graminis f. sp. tritici]|uniref:Secreted protein n=1 Tax=Puccinia graminis f. sp. tritici TaxID=56615 RepID=A0A5B0QMT2_PUCGR|nr:hypothetical protein PGT21_006559 [Puccinia graminis f. sp. tritici]
MIRKSWSLKFFNVSLLVMVALVVVEVWSTCQCTDAKRVSRWTQCINSDNGVCQQEAMSYVYQCKRCHKVTAPITMSYCEKHQPAINPRFYRDHEKPRPPKEKKEKSARKKIIKSSVNLCC